MGLEMAHADDAIRGAAAALLAKEKLEDLEVKCTIGIASGRVFCGTYGNEARHDYSVLGRTVNLASRFNCEKSIYLSAQAHVHKRK
jgi:class 3 adenylate cyclase